MTSTEAANVRPVLESAQRLVEVTTRAHHTDASSAREPFTLCLVFRKRLAPVAHSRILL